MVDTPSAPARIDWIDTAKAYGMFLVYYGHFVETLGDLGSPLALMQQKLIYAFHMPLFILLSGLVARTEPLTWKPFLKRQAASRLLPVLFFSLLMIPLEPLIDAVTPGRGHFRPTQISTRWVRGWDTMCQKLTPPHEESAAPARLWDLLDAEARAAIEDGAAGSELSPAQKTRIASGLDTLLSRPDLFAAGHFAGLDAPASVVEAAAQNPAALSGDDLRHRNWVLTWYTVQPQSRFFRGDEPFLQELLGDLRMTLQGYPVLNWLTWFLVCLFSVELIHRVCVRWLRRPARMLLAIPVFYLVGLLVTADMGRMGDVWFLRESVLLYAFYLLGLWLRRSGTLERLDGWLPNLLLLVVAGTVLGLTFPLNPGGSFKPVVLINLSQHGDPFWFPLTAVAGCLTVIALARLTPSTNLLLTTGRHTLILLGLNEIYMGGTNRAIGAALQVPDATVPILLWCLAVTVASMAACAPLVWGLDRWLPQLVGRPRQSGPLLPKLVD